MLYKLRKFLFGSKLIRSVKISIMEIKGMKPLKESFISKFLDFGYNKYTDFVIVPYETLCRFCYWGWKLRKNYSYNCNYSIYYILHLKFKGLIDYSRKYTHLCWNKNENSKLFRRLKIACYLSKRLYLADYNVNINKHDKKWNINWDNEFLFKSERKNNVSTLQWRSNQGLTKKQLNQKSKEFDIASDLDDLQKKNEKEYLFSIMSKYMSSWWD